MADELTSDEQLLDAAKRGDAVKIRHLLVQAVDIETRDSSGRTALLLATHRNAIEVARILIEAGADVSISDSDEVSPLAHARKSGYSEIIDLLVAAEN